MIIFCTTFSLFFCRMFPARYSPFSIRQHLYLSVMVFNAYFLIVSDDETTLAFQYGRKLSQSIHLSRMYRRFG